MMMNSFLGASLLKSLQSATFFQSGPAADDFDDDRPVPPRHFGVQMCGKRSRKVRRRKGGPAESPKRAENKAAAAEALAGTPGLAAEIQFKFLITKSTPMFILPVQTVPTAEGLNLNN
jgi:hypothetical protein